MSLRKCLLPLTLLALWVCLPSVVAADKISNDELVDRVVALYSPNGPNTSSYSGTSLIKMVENRWESLSKDHRKRIVNYLDEPIRSGPGAPDGQKAFETDHFQVIYQTKGDDAVPGGDSDGNGIHDYAEEVATYLEQAWAKEVVEFGFKAPPGSDKAKVRCHIKNINHNGLTHAATGKTAWIEMNSDIAAYTKRLIGEEASQNIVADEAGLQAGMLKACCAHEFFHCIQAAYDWEEENWWCEGTAEWAGDAVFPESKFYTNNVSPRFKNPHVSLFSKEGWFEYASSIWAFYLAENFGGHEIIRQIWEGCQGDKGVFQATQDAMGNLEEQFLYYACYNYLRAYADGSRFPEMKVLALEGAGTVSSEGIEAPQTYGANYFTVPSATKITVAFANGQRGGVRLITITNGRWKILPHVVKDGHFEVSIGDTENLEKIIIVVAGFQEQGDLAYTLTVE